MLKHIFSKVDQLLTVIGAGAQPTPRGAGAKANGYPFDKEGQYRRVVERIREVVPSVVAPGATIAVV